MPTERQMASERGGFVSPFDVAASSDIDNLLVDAEHIDGTGVGAVTVSHRVGREPQPTDRLHDAVAHGPDDPGVSVRIVEAYDR